MDPDFRALLDSRIVRGKDGKACLIVEIDIPTRLMRAAMSVWAAKGRGDSGALSAALAELCAIVTREVASGEVRGQLHRRVLLSEIGLADIL
jgi:hypothetical protein